MANCLENISDLGTRQTAKIEDLSGPELLVKTAEKVRSEVPKEEMNTKFAEL